MAGVSANANAILFISRNYPPMKGGLENYSYNLIRLFENHLGTYKIVLGKPRTHLLWFIPYCFVKALYLILSKDVKRLHLCDAFLAPLGLALGKLTGIQVTLSVHGLDITYPNRLYQYVIPRSAGKLDHIICVSKWTRMECIGRGIPVQKCSVIPNGVEAESFQGSISAGRRAIEELMGEHIGGRKIILYVGRLIERKGVKWFVSEVMPKLDRIYLLLVVGDGPEYEYIKQVIETTGLGKRVFLLGAVDDETRNSIYRAADIFIMPNVTIPGDVEGFGIAALEAGVNGLPVLASDIQGLKDAVIDGETGYLLEEKCARGFIEKIYSLNMERDVVRSVVKRVYGWDRIFRSYERVLLSKDFKAQRQA